jgi:hypothetical protein
MHSSTCSGSIEKWSNGSWIGARLGMGCGKTGFDTEVELGLGAVVRVYCTPASKHIPPLPPPFSSTPWNWEWTCAIKEWVGEVGGRS